MNHHYLCLGLACAIFSVASCNRNASDLEEVAAPSARDQIARLEKLYHRASDLKDYTTASAILLDLLDHQPNDAPRWKEEQVKAYFKIQNYSACAVVAKDLIDHHNGGSNHDLVEMYGVSQEAIGQKTEAIATWTGLMEKGGTPVNAVRLAGLLFDSNDQTRAMEVVEKALTTPELDKFSVQLPSGNGRFQNVNAAAALNNLKGLILLREDAKKNEAAARTAFSAALEKTPEFVIAKRNLIALNQASAPAPAATPSLEAEPPADTQ